MNSILGRINIEGTPINIKIFNKSVDKVSVFPSVKKETFTDNNIAFGKIVFPPFENNDKNSEINRNFIIVSDCKLYNREELLKELNIQNLDLSDEQVILMAFMEWREDCLKYLLGDFAFAIWDKQTQELFCARDHFGVKPFYYYFDSKSFVFSSEPASISKQDDVNLSIDEQFIADTISIVKSEKFRTTYNEIRKIPPAHYLILKNGKIEIKQYRKLKEQKTLVKTDEEIINEFRSILIESVKCRAIDENKIGAELSGGIDSSCVTAIASQFCQVKTFSHVLPDHLLNKIHPFKDEREFVNLVADYSNIQERYFITSERKSLIESLEQNINDFNGLTQQNFGVFSDQLYDSAMQQNVSVLLSGFGGDEVVSSKSSGYLNELAVNKQWKELRAELKSQKLSTFQNLKSLSKFYLKFYVQVIPGILSSITYKTPWWVKKFEYLALNTGFSKRLNIKKRYFLNYEKSGNLSLQEKNIERITHPHVSQRLEYCSLIARKYGIEYRYPLLDKRLIEYYLAIPTRLKAKYGIGRYAIRKAIESLVPEKIQWRNDKSGATIPTVFMRTMNDKKRISEIINRAKFNNSIKNYIDLDKYEKWFYRLCKRSEKTQKYINPGAFYNYLKLILFIEKNPELF